MTRNWCWNCSRLSSRNPARGCRRLRSLPILIIVQASRTGLAANENIACEPLGEGGVLVTLAREIGREAHERVRAFCAQLDETLNAVGLADARVADAGQAGGVLRGLIEYVPAYTTVALYFDPLIVDYAELREAALRIAARPSSTSNREACVVEIPVCYGAEFGPDLEDVAAQHGIAPTDVIRIHETGNYEVWMLGFAPGFAYLGGLSERIATPRRATPRVKVPAGSVGIAGAQTAVYPFDSPGGWQLIGRTPLRMFDPSREQPALLAPGDRVRFRAITRAEYEELCRAQKSAR